MTKNFVATTWILLAVLAGSAVIFTSCGQRAYTGKSSPSQDSNTVVQQQAATGNMYDDNNQNNVSFISEEQAKKAVLERAGLSENDITRYRCDLDEDDGFYHYEIEFVSGHYEYDADVSATDGKVISFEKENIFD